MNRLRQMSIFAHIVDEGSISSAASSLQLSKSVISQHLKLLELELGVTLLKRTTRRQTLTSVGKLFYIKCKDLNNIADSAWLDIQENVETPKGNIRITAPNALMEILITPAIGKLLQLYPQLDPELISNDDHLNLSTHDIDLAIRVGHSNNSNLKQKRIGEFRDVLCGVASTAQSSKKVEELPYISNVWQGKNIIHEFTSKLQPTIHYKNEARCITNSFHSCLSLIKAGAGIGIIPDFYMPFIKPNLERILPNHQLPVNPVYAIHPYGKQIPLSVKTCLNAIEEQFTKISLLNLNSG